MTSRGRVLRAPEPVLLGSPRHSTTRLTGLDPFKLFAKIWRRQVSCSAGDTILSRPVRLREGTHARREPILERSADTCA